MSEIIRDNVSVELLIGGNPWYVSEAEVELSRMDTANYVDFNRIFPDPEETAPSLPAPIDELIGSKLVLKADNALISNRDTDAEEEQLLFTGNLANISPTGENQYEAIGYDPSQQPIQAAKNSGSMMNTKVFINQPKFSFSLQADFSPAFAFEYEIQVLQASELVDIVLDTMGIPEEDRDIQLKEDGVTFEGEEGSVTGAYDRTLTFTQTYITARKALQHARERTESEWWFDKQGVFHFGIPNPSRHELRYITDLDAGKTTPPYQSVRVIGSGAASAEGYNRKHMDIEDKIVVEAELAFDEERNEITPNFGETKEPVFEYHNLEISTDEQAKSTATKLIEELNEQQAGGKIEVVGFPEIVPLDGVILPQAKNPTETNYHADQPMGGSGYNVYKVVHRLNGSDGFKTIIHVAGVTGATATRVSSRQATTSYDTTEIGDATATRDEGGGGIGFEQPGAEEIR